MMNKISKSSRKKFRESIKDCISNKITKSEGKERSVRLEEIKLFKLFDWQEEIDSDEVDRDGDDDQMMRQTKSIGWEFSFLFGW
jgi:hypothetical protein